MERTHVVTEKGINTIMAAKKYREIKKEFPIEEGKLVSDFENILDKIMQDLKSKLGKEYKKNSERGIAMINTVGAMVGAKVTDCLLYTSPSPRDGLLSRMPSSA